MFNTKSIWERIDDLRSKIEKFDNKVNLYIDYVMTAHSKLDALQVEINHLVKSISDIHNYLGVVYEITPATPPTENLIKRKGAK